METDDLMFKGVSYIKARDPSILSYNRPKLEEVRVNLIPELGADSTDVKQTENIRVYLRIKSGNDFNNLYKISGDNLVCKVPQGSQFLRNVKEGDSLRKIYTFSKIFEPRVNQTEIFNNVVKRKILDFINGQNSTLLTYGASGSGKTFTVIGTDEEPGLIPRSLEYLFRTLPKLSRNPLGKPLPSGEVSILDDTNCRREKQLCKNLLNASSLLMDKTQHARTYTAMQQRLSSEPVAYLEEHSNVSLAIWVSFAEIYNEQIYDLLQPNPPRGKDRPRLRLVSTKGHSYIKNLSNISVSSGLEAYQILQYGIHNLNYAVTSLNTHSSRSHSIFTIKLVQICENNGGTHISSFNFCDLAGSERSKKTMNVGDRLKESNNINTSLLVLGRCISAIRECQSKNDSRLIPFRESKLTQLFQKALSGYEDISMIVNINPVPEMFDETQHVLNFSAVAKDIAIDRQPDVHPKKKNRFSQMIENRSRQVEETTEFDSNVEELQNVISYLQNQLEEQRNEFEINEKVNRDFLISGYEKILHDTEENTNRRVKEAEAYLRFQYEAKIQNIKIYYEKLLREERDKNEVILLDSSVQEKNEELEETVKEQKELIASLQNFVTQMKIENEQSNFELKELKEQFMKLKVEKDELTKTLDDGIIEFLQLKQINQKKETDILKLKEKCFELENELNLYRGQNAVDSDTETESLTGQEEYTEEKVETAEND